MAENIKVENKETKKATISVAEHPVFEGDMKTNIISTIDMADVVSSLFAPAFSDYYGCKIRINNGENPFVPSGVLYVDLYFKDRGTAADGAWKNIVPRGSVKTGNRIADGLQRITGQGTGRVYEVTKETYEALEAFSFAGNRTNWMNLTQEISTNMSVYGMKEEVVVCISGIDLNRVISEIYGNKTEEGLYDYVATPATPIPGKVQEFILQVCQLNKKAVRDLQRDLGVYNPNSPQFHQYR